MVENPFQPYFAIISERLHPSPYFLTYFEELIATNCYNTNKFLKTTNNFKNIFLN